MSAVKIADDIWWVGVKDPDLTHFDIIMELKYGTTYNSYLIRGSEQVALIDSVKATFIEEHLASIRQIIPLDRIDYLVVNHTEPDHGGGIAFLLERAPQVKLLCAAPALPFVKNIVNREDIPIEGIKDGHLLDLGGKKLVFKSTPYMHWPDTMMEYLTEEKILFSCDGFAAHLAFDSIYADQTAADFDHEFWRYFDSIMRPFAPYIRRHAAKLASLDIRSIAPSHGPIIRRQAETYINKYAEWSADKAAGKNQVTIFYVSAYGNTRRLSEAVASGISEMGYNPVLIDCFHLDEAYARDQIENARAILFGTPTFNGDAVRPIWDAINLLSTVASAGKKAAVFGSYGWSGEAGKLVSDRLTGLRLKVYPKPFRARLIPSDEEMAGVRNFCKELVEFLNSK